MLGGGNVEQYAPFGRENPRVPRSALLNAHVELFCGPRPPRAGFSI